MKGTEGAMLIQVVGNGYQVMPDPGHSRCQPLGCILVAKDFKELTTILKAELAEPKRPGVFVGLKL